MKINDCPTPLSKYIGWGTWIRTREMSESKSDALPLGYTPNTMVEGGRVELPNPKGTELQSAAFGHFAIPPFRMVPTRGIEPPTY